MTWLSQLTKRWLASGCRDGCGIAVGVLLSVLLFDRGAAAAPTAATELTVSDFAYAMRLDVQNESPVQALVLPREVLLRVDPDRAAVRVFDAAGQLVPYAIRELELHENESSQVVSLPFFPIVEQNAASSHPSSVVSVQVARRADGTLVKVAVPQSSEKRAGDDSGVMRSVVIDASQLPRGIARMHFSLSGTEPSFVWRVALERSSDLLDFVRTPVRGSLVSLRHGEFSIDAHDLELDGLSAPYLRLTWEGLAPARIDAIEAELVARRRAVELPVLEVDGQRDTKQASTWQFDLGASLPVRSLEFTFSEPNTLIEGSVEMQRDVDSPSHSLGARQFYQVERAGRILRGAPVRVSGERMRHVRLVVSPKGGGLGSGAVRLRARTAPEQLLFLARGQGPFQLAFGRHGAAAASVELSDLSGLLDGVSDELNSSTVEMGPIVETGGAALLEAPTPGRDWRRLALWSALSAAVLLLGGLSVALWRRMDRVDAPRDE